MDRAIMVIFSIDCGVTKGRAFMAAFLIQWGAIKAGIEVLLEYLASTGREIDWKKFLFPETLFLIIYCDECLLAL